jgi:ABC-2 type transport system ATP-binding protein
LADICNKVGIIEKGEMQVCAEVAEVMRRVRQQPVLQVAVVGDQQRAAKVLEQHRFVDRVELRNGHMMVTLASGTKDYSELSTLLVSSGFPLSTFKEDEINLETAFMALTKGITA